MFHMKHLFFLKRIITKKKTSGIGEIPEVLYREEKEERRLLSDFASSAYPA